MKPTLSVLKAPLMIGLINLRLSLVGSCRPVKRLTKVPTTTTMMTPIKVYHQYDSFKRTNTSSSLMIIFKNVSKS